ncbi:MAG: YtxH domain-containing protein [Saprospiraceae bacterium]|nr:YtxH domain-containing protein [Saprospiraceae bacterium]
MNTGKILLGFLAGMAAGAVLGVLFAPDKGTETRKKIAGKSFGYLTKVGNQFNEIVDEISEKAKNVKKDATRVVSNGKVKIEEVEDKFISSLMS